MAYRRRDRKPRTIDLLVSTINQTRLLGYVASLASVLACSGEIGSPSSNSDMPIGDSEFSDPTGEGTSAGDATDTGQPGGSSATGTSTQGSAQDSPNASPTTTSTSGVSPSDSIIDAIGNASALPMVLDGHPLYSRVIRLTHEQWENSVRYLLNVADTGQQQNLAADVSAVYDFTNNEELLFMNANLYRDYQMAAEELSLMLASDEGAVSAIAPGQDAGSFIETVGRRAYRRALTPDEVQRLQARYDEAAASANGDGTPHAHGVASVMLALLQSPHFLYRTEFARAGERLSGYEIAAKLSLLLKRVTPDDALLDAARDGRLDSDQGVREVAANMLNDSDATEAMRQFHGELFGFDNYLTIIKDPDEVPEYPPELNAELEEAAYLFFDRIYEQSLGLTDILTSTVGFVGPTMAPFYGVDVSGGMQELDLGPERPGFFTQLPFLVQNSQNLVPDPIHRGVTLNLDVLCSEVPLPGMVETKLPPFDPAQTNRERVSAGTGPGTCGATCHAPYINPLGFAFENFDGLGRLRETDNGKTIDTRAEYPFKEGSREFSGAPELMQIISEGEQAHACYSKHLASFVLQRELSSSDSDLVDALMLESHSGASIKELLQTLVSSEAFTTRVDGGVQ